MKQSSQILILKTSARLHTCVASLGGFCEGKPPIWVAGLKEGMKRVLSCKVLRGLDSRREHEGHLGRARAAHHTSSQQWALRHGAFSELYQTISGHQDISLMNCCPSFHYSPHPLSTIYGNNGQFWRSSFTCHWRQGVSACRPLFWSGVIIAMALWPTLSVFGLPPCL